MGRKFFTFETEGEAAEYARRWALMRGAALPLPTELLQSSARPDARTLGVAIRDYANSGLAAPSTGITLSALMGEVGGIKMSAATYAWAAAYVRSLKVDRNLSPSSIKARVSALARSIDEYVRNHPDCGVVNHVRALPRGYASYSDVDTRLAVAAGGVEKKNKSRKRRLMPGEYERIYSVLSGEQTAGRQRPLDLQGGIALRTMFAVIVHTGLRLQEAFTLTRGQVDMTGKFIRARCSKQWRGGEKWRDVPITPALHAELQAYFDAGDFGPGDAVFPFLAHYSGSNRSASSALSIRFATAFRHAGCAGLIEHDLRHEATCRWLEMRRPDGSPTFRDSELDQMMGWTPGSTMAARYASFGGADLASRMWPATPMAAEGLVVAGGVPA